MRTCLWLVLGAGLVGCASGEEASEPAEHAADAPAVEAAVNGWFNTAIASLDTAAVSAGLTSTFLILEDTLRMDRAGFARYVAQQIASIPGPFTIRYTFSEWDTRVAGDVAWTSFRNRAVLTPSQGEPTNLEWLETAVLQRVDGRWLIERYHSAPVRRGGM